LTLKVEGMSCAHCERRIEGAVSSVDGVESAIADAGKGTLDLVLSGDADRQQVLDSLGSAVQLAGYTVISEVAARSRRRDSGLAIAFGLIIAGAFALADAFGLFAMIPSIDLGLGFGALFVAGLLTSLHCISMCGGIALSQGLKGSMVTDTGLAGQPGQPGLAGQHGQSGQPGLAAALGPSAAYNIGRIVSYTLIGALAGALGAALDIGMGGRAVLMGFAGLFMMAMGLSLAGILRLPRLDWPAWQRFRLHTGIKAARLGPFAVGLANGFMPCGPLQTMQVYALGSGSAVAGALAMFAFSAGTAPLLFAFGAGGALVPQRYRFMAVKAGAVLVAFLGLMTVGRAWALSGLTLPWQATSFAVAGSQVIQPAPGGRTGTGGLATGSQSIQPALGSQTRTSGLVAEIRAGIQYVTIEVGPRNYGEIVVQAGLPVRFNLHVGAGMLNGCNNAIVIPALNLKQALMIGDNVVEFTAPASGIIPYSCWMGMIRSRITVVDRLSSSPAPADPVPTDPGKPPVVLVSSSGGLLTGSTAGLTGGLQTFLGMDGAGCNSEEACDDHPVTDASVASPGSSVSDSTVLSCCPPDSGCD
jgi:sulfite exporter TauE/SafE/copper chaperone CopZ